MIVARNPRAGLQGRVGGDVAVNEATGPSIVATAHVDGLRLTLIGLATFGDPLRRAMATSDTATALINAYRRDGVGMLAHLHGQFALAVVDENDDSALLAVDRLACATLCFATLGNELVFGSDAGEVAAILRRGRSPSSDGSGSLDPQAIFDYLYSHCIPGPATVYRGVQRLLAGHMVRFDRGAVTVDAYWSPHYEERVREPLATLETGFIDTVRASVKRAIDGADRPGCFLSGGTDSSTIAGLLTEVAGRPAESYSIGFDAEGFDEMKYARTAAKRFGTHHHEYYITPADLVRSIPAIAAAYDQPFGNSSVLPTYYCAKMAEADGIDRMLGGDGGDELFGGNVRYAKQRVFDRFDRAPGAIKSLLKATLSPSAWEAVPVVRKARSYVRQAAVPMPDRLQTYNLLTRIGPATIFEPAFLAQVDTDAPIREMRDWYARSDATSLVNRMLAFDLKYTLTDNDLPKVVTACRLAGVDVAFPLLDDDVMAFAERLDPELKLKGLQLRWFFKHALRDFLPPEILTKSKHGFGLPFGIWLGRDPALNELAFSSLESLKARGIVRADFIDQLRADLLADHATYYGELVWVLMMLEQWLQAHVDAPASMSTA